ncbi:YihY/virulence factor BrkB family protein [Aquipuribacter sp. MA13-6]|uniref:YihY/virulence factor BrkB family protein n=1 Tax=unclassified Aquipuribacter TaxID=2635084 RepID=UPI003EE9FC4D
MSGSTVAAEQADPTSRGLGARLKGLLGWVMRSRPYRANERLGQARGGILAAGIAFYGVFSLFPLLTLGFTAMGLWLGNNVAVQQQLIEFVETSLPGLVGEGDSAIVAPDTLLAGATDTTVLGISAVVGVLTLLYTGLGWIAALREGIRGVFRLPTMRLDPVRAKLFDLAVMLSLGSLIVASALANVAAQSFTEQLLDLLGLDRTPVGNVVVSAVVLTGAVLLNTALFTMLYRVLAHTDARLRSVVPGALLAALGVAALQLAVGAVLGNVGANAGFLASAAIPILTLFVWLNLNARVMLFGAAWVAVGRHPDPPVLDDEVPPRVPLPRPSPPVLPRRWSDRALLGAGVVLGATALGIVRVANGAAKAAGDGVRTLVRGD